MGTADNASFVGDFDARAEAHDLTTEAQIVRYLSRIHRFAVMVSPRGSDPDDVAQQAVLKALERADRFDPRRGTLDAWLWRIVVNTGRDAGRVARRREFLMDRLMSRESSVVGDVSTESLALDRMRDRELIAAVGRLPGRYRTLVALRYGAGLPSGQIAELLGTTRMAVVKGTRRALDRMRMDLMDLIEPEIGE